MSYVLCAIDIFSKFVWLFPLPHKTAEGVCICLYELFGIFGVPDVLHSDNGKEFDNELEVELRRVFRFECVPFTVSAEID